MFYKAVKRLYKKVLKPIYQEGVLGFSERNLALLQGKGYGTATIKSEISAIKKLLNVNEISICIDIGGNIGNYTAQLNFEFPTAKIFTFEPSRTNFEVLINRFSDNENITILPYAVSDSEGTATLFSDEKGSGLASLTKRDLSHRNKYFDLEENVAAIRFEKFWLNELDGHSIDLLKIDIEGHELAALKGCGHALAKTKIIQFEFGGCNIDTRTYFRDFWNFLSDNKFDLFRITPFGAKPILTYSERDEYFSTTNYLAINRGNARVE